MILTPDELVGLTGKRRASAQARELAALHIPFKRRSDGSVIVLRIHLEGQPRPDAKLAGPKVDVSAL